MPSAIDLVSFARCPHRVHLDASGDAAEKLPASAFLQLLWENGRAHEDTVVAGMDVTTLPHGLDHQARAAATLDLLRGGAPRIYHGYLESGDLTGEPGLLDRVETPSKLGRFAYVPVDIKSASAFEGGNAEKPKRHYLFQLSVYAELLEVAQGWRPDIGRIIDADGEMQTLDLRSSWPAYQAARERLSAILAGAEETTPGWKSGECSMCSWQAHCWGRLEETDDLTTVAGIGEGYRAKLWSIGVKTAADLAASTMEALVDVKGIGESRAVAWPRQARAQKRGTPEVLALWTPPDVSFEVSYDIEDFTPDPFVYLHGLLIREASARPFGSTGHEPADFGVFDPICASLPGDDEASVWRRFLARIERLDAAGDYAVYVYSHHERSTLARLAGRYGGSGALEGFTDRFVDLEGVVRDHVVFPTDSRGLKSVARFVGFDWRDDDPGGAQSMVWWSAYLDDPVGNAALRDRILAYNEDDVRASFALLDWMKDQIME